MEISYVQSLKNYIYFLRQIKAESEYFIKIRIAVFGKAAAEL